MNSLEKKMVDALADLRENHHTTGIKAEFEDEGTRFEEAVRLKEIVSAAGLDLTVKIGGCGAMKDMQESKLIGVSKIVAPMIESPFALRKFINSAKSAFPDKEVKFFVNIETILAYKNLDDILESESIKYLDGIVIGRGDLTESMGLTRNDINKAEIFNLTSEILKKAKQKNLICGIGGGVCADSLQFFENLPFGLDFFETRKVLFKFPEVMDKNPRDGILKAMGFEIMWLKNKQNYYYSNYEDDKIRVKTLESRYQKSILEAGGVLE